MLACRLQPLAHGPARAAGFDHSDSWWCAWRIAVCRYGTQDDPLITGFCRSVDSLMATRRLAERLEQRPKRIELRAEATPVSGLQALEGAVKMGERLAGARIRGARGCRRLRGGGKRRRRSNLLEERRQCCAQRLF